MSDLAAALMIAIRVHAHQRDKQGEPYLLHILRVVEAVSGERAKVLAALHDVIEDGGYLDLEALFEENGMWIANSVEVLTRAPSETYAEYIQSIDDGHSGTWVAAVREVKIADLRDNLGRIPAGPCKECACGNPSHTSTLWSQWNSKWGLLKARYEKALATLEAVTPHPAHERARADQEEDR